MPMHSDMPKGSRSSRSQGYYRNSSAISTALGNSQHYSDQSRTSSHMNNPYYPTLDNLSQSHPQQSYSTAYATGGPVQHPSMQHYTTHVPPPAPPSLPTPPPVSLRASSGAWTPHDDAQLMSARSQGMNWLPIQQQFFPSKSANACRKRHERLMERRNADDWDGVKLEVMAKTYMGMRREIWGQLAELTGEKWSVVEQKCMSQGLKNLQTHARSHARRERLLDSHALSHPHTSHSHSHSGSLSSLHNTSPQHNTASSSANSLSYNPNSYASGSSHLGGGGSGEDSGISLELEDLEADYDHDQHDHNTDEASERSRSVGSVYGNSNSYGHARGGHSHSHSSSASSGGSRGGWNVNGMVVSANGMVGGGGVMHARLPSMSDNMGIESIINRTTAR